MDGFPVLIFALFAVIAIAVVVHGIAAAKRRREEMEQVAARLGLRFSPDKDRGLASHYGFLNKLAQGSNRYAFNVLHGAREGHDVRVFDYHYETRSSDSEGRRKTRHHHLSCFLLQLPRAFPEVTIVKEGLLSKIAQAFGYDDINFESAEFSRTFCVRSKDKRFAYDVCHARMIEYLLANRDLNLEIDDRTLALVFNGQMAVKQIEFNLDRLLQVRRLLPEYLFTHI